MEKRSRRRTRDLVTQAASQGLSENEIGCVRISIMARSTNAPFAGRIQKRKTYPLHYSHPACNARPVHTERVMSGLARAREQGTKLGRPRVDGKKEEAIRRARAGGKGIRRVARDLGVGVGTMLRITGESATLSA